MGQGGGRTLPSSITKLYIFMVSPGQHGLSNRLAPMLFIINWMSSVSDFQELNDIITLFLDYR